MFQRRNCVSALRLLALIAVFAGGTVPAGATDSDSDGRDQNLSTMYDQTDGLLAVFDASTTATGDAAIACTLSISTTGVNGAYDVICTDSGNATSIRHLGFSIAGAPSGSVLRLQSVYKDSGGNTTDTETITATVP